MGVLLCTTKTNLMQIIRSSLTILILLTTFASNLSAQFAGGAGTSASPYQVNTLAHLNTIAGNSSYWDKHFVQTANIDASSTSTQNSGAGFTGIGTVSSTFIGSYDGQGYSITGLFMNLPTTNHVGMFNYIHLGAVVKNLNMINADITGQDFVGGIVGYAELNTVLQNLTIDTQSSVTGDDYVGGITGEAQNATITDCSSAAAVSGSSAIGGIAGECWNNGVAITISGCSSSGTISATCCDAGGLLGINAGQTVTNCWSSSTVNCTGTTSSNVGGLIGYNNGLASLCYTTGTVTSTTADVGGLVGEIGTNGSVERCYSRATVESTMDNVGGLVGIAYGNITNCFAMATVAGSDVGGLVGVTRGTCVVSYCYAASKVINTTNDDTGGLIADNDATENNCFWIDLFSDDNATAPDETNDFDADIKIVSDVTGATKDFTVSALTGSNAPTTMSAFDFTTVWDVAPAGAPGSFPVLRNLTAPADAPAAPTKFTIASGNNKLTLAWASNYETDIASYKIYRSTTANFTPAAGDLLATVTHATGGLSYTDDGSGALAAPVNGTLYYYVLVAVDNSGNTSFYHRGAQKPAQYFANVSISVLTTGGVTYSDIHGSSASDISAVYSTTMDGNITNSNSLVPDGSGDDQGMGHPSSITGGALTITPSGLQPGQNWYLYYDDNTVAGNPIRNLTGGAGTGTTLLTGKGNTPVTVTTGLDPDFTDYLFYVDALRTNSAPSLNNITTLNSPAAPVILDADVTATDPESSVENGGAGNFNGFSLVIQRQGGASSNDVIVLSAPDANYVISGGIVKYAAKQVGTYALVAGVFTLQFSGTEVIPTQTIVNSLLRGIKYYHKGTAPAQVTLDWTLSDGTASVTVSQLITGSFELNFYSGDSGDVSDPWKLSNLTDLRELSRNTFHWADYFIVTANINASGSANFDDTDDNADGNLFNDPNDATASGTNTGFSPIGNITTVFTGNFNGQSYTISGLKMVRATSDYLGLFGVTSGAIIRNVVITGVDITGDDETGGLIGKATNTTVTSCSISGDVFGNDDNVGGLIGYAIDTDVNGCSFAGDVNGNTNTGGLIGQAEFASLSNKVIKNSFSTGTVTADGDDVGGLIGESGYLVDSCYSTVTLTSTDASGDSYYGGLIGYAIADVSHSHATGNITASGSSLGGLIGEAQNCNVKWCFATGNTSGVGNVGGLIGFYDNNAATQSYSVTNCYAKGNSTGTGSDVGGLVGEAQLDVSKSYSTGTSTAASNSGGLIGNLNGGTVTASFWDKQTSGKTTSGGGTGKTTIEMKSPCTYENAGWDFAGEIANGTSNPWTMNATDNAGYPTLSQQNYTHTLNCLVPFVTEWTFSSATSSIVTSAQTSGVVLYSWSASPSGNTGTGSFTKTTAGQVTITINASAGDVVTLSIESHNLKRFYLDNSSSSDKLTDVIQWGGAPWTSMEKMFYGCNTLGTLTATDAPDLSLATNMSEMFSEAGMFDTDISGWDVSGVTNMSKMFYNAFAFNQNIGSWDVSGVTNMSEMFFGCSVFNQDISPWNTASVTTMSSMFNGAAAFNQNIGTWNTASVTNMSNMFTSAAAFDGDISTWNTSGVTDMDAMFANATVFNQDISSWNTASVTRMGLMFGSTNNFNQDISSWNTGNVTDMNSMFYNALAFNQDIGNWNTASVTNMSLMFNGAAVFNQDLSTWDVSSVTDMNYMFADAASFDSDVSTWNTANVTDMSAMFYGTPFNQDISGWDAGQVLNFSSMFEGTSSFNQDISSWNTGSALNMTSMFKNATSFNQDISGWSTGSVTDMTSVFQGATSFNQDISGWDVSQVQFLNDMLSGATSFNQSLGSWSLASGVDMSGMLDNCGMSCVNYSQTLIGWKNYANVPSGITLGAAGLEYGTSATSSRNNLVNVKSWTITGDMAGTGACLPCPVFTAAPADVTIVNSSCSSGCTLAGGTITAPSNTGSNKGNVTPGSPCPAGSSIEYQVNGGAWTTTLPVYDQDGPAQTVKTRCTCDSDNTVMSAESAGVTTVPGVCTPPAPSISGDAEVCPAESAMLTVTGTGTYTWSNSLGSNATVNVTPPSTTTYTVTATDSNGCTGTATATVTVYQSPVPGITDVENSGSANDDGIICVGAGVNVSGSGGVDYAWSEGQTTSSFFIRPYCTTSYELTVTDANGCTATAGTTVFVNYTPEIQTVSPTSGSAGTTVTITGTHLSDVTDVTFNGVAGTNVNVISSTEVRANLPSSGTLSDVTVVSPCGEVNIDVAAPVIYSFSPGAGPVGTLITVLGDHLDNLTSVTVGGVSAAVVSNNGNTLVIAVMPGSTTGSISLNSGGGSTGTQGSFTVTSTPYPYFQQGGKRVGTNSSSTAQQATSLAISTDGSTVVIGAPGDNSNTGAAWVFTKDGSNWVQLGGKLVGTGAVGQSRQGASVAIGLEGNTIALGAPGDNSNAGAVWIFTRNGSSWTQQGEKLVGSGAAGAAQQGTSVALSGDGNTVAFGGISDDFYNGAAWAFVRTDGVWAQQGSKMVSSGAIGRARQGASVALSADGNTMIVGAYQDDNRKGAVWIYTRTDCEWMQAGAKLVGTGGTSQAWQGYSVALSADGNTAVAGASADNSLIGATWVFTRSGGSWTQQGNRLVGTHSTSTARQGSSVALSADGNTAITGGLNDDSGKGAMWVFTRNGTTWSQQGSKLKGTSAVGASKQGTAVAVNAIGTTALIGGPADNGSKGAFWVYSLGSIPSVKKEITEDRNNEQAAFVLGQSVPNPSTGQFTIGFDVPEGCIAEWIFSDMNGRVVRSLKREYPAGANQESFDLQGNTGVYFYQLKTPAGIKTGKITIVGY